MTRYSVFITVDESFAERFEEYMRSKHIPDVLSTGRFVRASIWRSEGTAYRVDYVAEHREQLERYLAEDTERLREAFASEYPFEVSVERETADLVDSWETA